MKRCLQKYIRRRDVLSILAVIVLGTVNHFLYAWSGDSPWAALFCPINESPWEHLKLLYFPFLFLTLWNSRRYRSRLRRFLYVRFLGVLCGLAFILITFYTYSGILGRDFLAADILIFCLSVVLSFLIANILFRKELQVPPWNAVVSLWIVLALCFFAFTCFPPDLPLFY